MANGDRQTDENRAGMVLTLRAAVAGYLIYLGYGLLRDQLRGLSTLRPWLAWGCGAAFIAVGLGFGWYSWRRYRSRGGDSEDSADESDGAPSSPD